MILFAMLALWAQAAPEPRVVRAQQQTRPAGGNLDAEFRAIVRSQEAPAWIAYTVPRAPRGGDSCSQTEAPPGGRPVMLEGGRQAVILFRVERREVVRIRAYSIDCEMDGGDLPLLWLSGVRPADSVALLDTFARLPDETRYGPSLAASAVYAIGAHADPAALDLLIAKARTEKSRSVRRAAFSAIGRLQDPRAFAFLQEILAR